MDRLSVARGQGLAGVWGMYDHKGNNTRNSPTLMEQFCILIVVLVKCIYICAKTTETYIHPQMNACKI